MAGLQQPLLAGISASRVTFPIYENNTYLCSYVYRYALAIQHNSTHNTDILQYSLYASPEEYHIQHLRAHHYHFQAHNRCIQAHALPDRDLHHILNRSLPFLLTPYRSRHNWNNCHYSYPSHHTIHIQDRCSRVLVPVPFLDRNGRYRPQRPYISPNKLSS